MRTEEAGVRPGLFLFAKKSMRLTAEISPLVLFLGMKFPQR